MRILLAILFTISLTATVCAQEQISRGTIKKVDPKAGILTVTSDGKDIELTAVEDTRYIGPDGQGLKDGLRDPQFKAGTLVMFKSVVENGTTLLIGVRINPLPSPEAIQAGKIKKVDVQKGVLTVTGPGGKDVELNVTQETRYIGPDGNAVEDGLRDARFKEGAPVMFKAITKENKTILIGVRVGMPEKQGFKDPPRIDTANLKPLTEMGSEKHQGFLGGLYPGGKNERPAVHEKEGMALARLVRPLDADGKPSPSGKIGLLSVGMSNTTQVFSTFKRLADEDPDRNPNVAIIDGAQGGMTAFRIQDPNGAGRQFWNVVDARLKQAGLTRAQVQAVWIKEADAGPSQGFPKYAETLRDELAAIVRIFPERFPNVKLVYLSSRTFAGYAKTRLNPEPYALESGFSVKWLIEKQIEGDKSLNFDATKGPVAAPWLSWGPYLWANGLKKNSAGLFYEEADFAADGTHPSMQGQQKIARELLRFFKTDTTTRSWFVK